MQEENEQYPQSMRPVKFYFLIVIQQIRKR